MSTLQIWFHAIQTLGTLSMLAIITWEFYCWRKKIQIRLRYLITIVAWCSFWFTVSLWSMIMHF